MGAHTSESEFQNALKKMEKVPGANLNREELNLIHSSLVVEKCLECHAQDTLALLALKSPAERLDITGRMLKKTGRAVTADDVHEINRSLQIVFGF
jgi:hypothetical protein